MMAARKKPAAEPVEPTALVAQVAVCVIDGCQRPVLHRGLCAAHWETPQGDDDN
ncbi:MAG TPA: hypothetical protein VFR13_09205 [Jiangellaceae bacterium]|nr:hypothetical protein [Jiangellaceae bacterium]